MGLDGVQRQLEQLQALWRRRPPMRWTLPVFKPQAANALSGWAARLGSCRLTGQPETSHSRKTGIGRQRRTRIARAAAYKSGKEANRAIGEVNVNQATTARDAPMKFNATQPVRPAAKGVR